MNQLATTTTHVNATLRFLVACLSTLGAFPWLTFTAYGLARLPLALLRGEGQRQRDEQLATYAERKTLLGPDGEDDSDSYGENLNPVEGGGGGGRYAGWKQAGGPIGEKPVKPR